MKIKKYLKPKVVSKRIQTQLYRDRDSINPLRKEPTDGSLYALNCCSIPSSDMRLKTNIKQLKNALEKVEKMRGVSFDWKNADNNELKKKEDIGVIAQEIENIFPQLVGSDKNGFKIVNYTRLVAVLIEAVKELNEKYTALEKRVNLLEKKR